MLVILKLLYAFNNSEQTMSLVMMFSQYILLRLLVNELEVHVLLYLNVILMLEYNILITYPCIRQ